MQARKWNNRARSCENSLSCDMQQKKTFHVEIIQEPQACNFPMWHNACDTTIKNRQADRQTDTCKLLTGYNTMKVPLLFSIPRPGSLYHLPPQQKASVLAKQQHCLNGPISPSNGPISPIVTCGILVCARQSVDLSQEFHSLHSVLCQGSTERCWACWHLAFDHEREWESLSYVNVPIYISQLARWQSSHLMIATYVQDGRFLHSP